MTNAGLKDSEGGQVHSAAKTPHKPETGRRNSVAVSCIDLVWDEESEQSFTPTTESKLVKERSTSVGSRDWMIEMQERKRKRREDTEPDKEKQCKRKESPEVYELSEGIKGMDMLVQKLRTYIEQNTKKEIKELTIKMERQMANLKKQIVTDFLNKHRYDDPGEIKQMDADMQTEKKVTRETATQTGAIERVGCYPAYKEQSKLEWKEEDYKNTEVKVGNPLNSRDKVPKVVLVGPGEEKMDTSIQALYSRRYPELLEISENFGIIEQNYKIRTKGKEVPVAKKIIKITHNGTEEEIFNRLMDLKEEVKKDEWVVMHEIGGVPNTILRKIVESIFHETMTKVNLY